MKNLQAATLRSHYHQGYPPSLRGLPALVDNFDMLPAAAQIAWINLSNAIQATVIDAAEKANSMDEFKHLLGIETMKV